MGASAEMVKKIYESFSNADIPAILDNVAEDVQWSAAGTLPHGGQFQGKSDMMRYFQGVGAAWETLAVDLESVGEVGEDLVAAVLRLNGTLRGGGPRDYGVSCRSSPFATGRSRASVSTPIWTGHSPDLRPGLVPRSPGRSPERA